MQNHRLSALRHWRAAATIAGVLGAVGLAGRVHAANPWMDTALSPDVRAELMMQDMSLGEQISLLHGIMPMLARVKPKDVIGSAGYVPGIPRLGIPPLQESDAGVGVANLGNIRPGDQATPMPSGLAVAASWNPLVAYRGGAVIGSEAWSKGFNVQLAGGVDLVRDPRNGRNFEYAGEDPLLAGTMAGEAIRGIQDQHIVSTAKHYAVNDQEIGRNVLSANVSEAVLRESDLLAFQIAIEHGDPGSIMCSYNRINGIYACENPDLMTKALKGDWGYRGWVMSDWGAVHSTKAAALAGLDQESGEQLDRQIYFGAPLKQAVEAGEVPAARVHDMVHRILRSLFAKGVIDRPPTATQIDYPAHAKIARGAAEEGIVLLRNAGNLLPLPQGIKKIAVIGGHADVGVLSGGGSSQVVPVGGFAAEDPVPKGAPSFVRSIGYDPSSPMRAIQVEAPGAVVAYSDGGNMAAAATLAQNSDIAFVFVTQWATEGMDQPNLSLPGEQDRLVEAVAAANPHTIVVLETGGPVLMPWLGKVGAVLEAWYPGAGGGEAIAAILFGGVNPSGRLPVTFPAGESQLPHPAIPGADLPTQGGTPPPFDLTYPEGSDVGYRWFARRALEPLFPFGFGLSYSSFSYGDLKITGGKNVTARFTVSNTGSRAGADVPQIYLTSAAGIAKTRLLGWSKLTLKPGETRRVAVTADPRLLADFDAVAHRWRLRGGDYAVALGASATDLRLRGSTSIAERLIKP